VLYNLQLLPFEIEKSQRLGFQGGKSKGSAKTRS
jgi:hypothetical protein